MSSSLGVADRVVVNTEKVKFIVAITFLGLHSATCPQQGDGTFRRMVEGRAEAFSYLPILSTDPKSARKILKPE